MSIGASARKAGGCRRAAREFGRDQSGQVALLFGFAIFALVVGVGGSFDLARAYMARQKLSQVATLACQYASRPSVVQTVAPNYSGANGGTIYQSKVNNYINATLVGQAVPYSQTNAAPFTYTPGGPADVNLAVTVPTTFMNVARITQLPVTATAHCYDNATSLQQNVPNGSSSYLVQEGFEVSGCTGTCYSFFSPTGTSSARTTALNTFPSSPGYTGANGNAWYIMGYCVEIDAAGVIKPAVAEGTHSAELDCDNGSGTGGNSSISTQMYLPAGSYELRYFYVGRVGYPDYDPVYLCGSAASDVSWATSTNSTGGPVANASRTNQVNVYLDQSSGGVPPTHTTIDGTQALAGSNLIDMCVTAKNWVERSVRVSVTSPGYYWLSFAADGLNESYGGQIDYIRFCPQTCPGTLQDNFPVAWTAAANGGVNKVLHEDTFEAPVYTANYTAYASTNGNLNLSTGTFGALSGWTGQTAAGWAAAPYNEVFYLLLGSAQGSQSLQLDSTTPGSTNRSMGRPFLLVPGYYRVDYNYISNASFTTLTGTYCGATPTAANLSALSGSGTATVRVVNQTLTLNRDTNIVGVFMSHAQLASTPIGGGAFNSQTSFTNPNGTTSTTPTVPPNGLSLTSYDPTQPNPLIDICGYATAWQSRSATIKILKPAYYWLTAAALGSADGVGGSIDDVKITALGSPFMSSPPTGAVTIPVPNPQPSATLSFTGFTLTADPFAPPAP